MEFSRQEYWSGLPFLSPEDLPDPWMELWSPASQADSLLFELQGRPVLAGWGAGVGGQRSGKRIIGARYILKQTDDPAMRGEGP